MAGPIRTDSGGEALDLPTAPELAELVRRARQMAEPELLICERETHLQNAGRMTIRPGVPSRGPGEPLTPDLGHGHSIDTAEPWHRH